MDDITQRRTRWLHIAKSITTATIARSNLIRSACVTASMTDEDDQEADRQTIERLSKRILSDLIALANIEAQEPHLGARAVLGKTSKVISHAFVMMVAARMSGEAAREVNLVGDLIDHVAVRNPDMALEIRCAFRHDGPLRPHVWFSKADVIDYSRIQLTESAFNTALGLDADAEFDALSLESRRMSR